MLSSSAELDTEPLPLSYLSQYSYCPRRCGLLLLDRVWLENEYTAAGRAQHERVHTARVERRGPLLSLYETPVFSRRLGISGLCDCVEARESPDGIPLPFGPGSYQLYPVEYKHGTVRDEEEYHIQLCAQALCMEEMYRCAISSGAIFFIDAHRRDEVLFTPALRTETERVACALRALSDSTILPEATYGPKCKKCSLADHCQPKLKSSAATYRSMLWSFVLEGELPT